MRHLPVPDTALFAPDYPIETARLLLRPFIRADVDAVFSYRQLESVAEYLFDQPMSHEECAEAVRCRAGEIALMGEGDKLILAVVRRSDSWLIGEVSMIWRSVVNRQAEIGYIFHPDVHGRGYATEAAAALLAFGFGTMDLHRIYARCDARNIRSAKVMQRLGMRLEAHFKGESFVKGRWDEVLVYAILEDEWRSQPPLRFESLS